jgi:hypothetical protein
VKASQGDEEATLGEAALGGIHRPRGR